LRYDKLISECEALFHALRQDASASFSLSRELLNYLVKSYYQDY